MTTEQQRFEITTVPDVEGKSSRFIPRSGAISLLAFCVGLACGVGLWISAGQVVWDHWLWEKLAERGIFPYLIVGSFFFGFSYLLFGLVCRVFPTVSAVHTTEADLEQAVKAGASTDILLPHLQNCFKANRVGGHRFLHTRLAKLWNGFCRGATTTDLRAQNETLSSIDADSVSIVLIPLDIAMWAMPVLGFIGTVWGAGDAVSGLADAIVDVIHRGTLNTHTLPYLREAFAGLSVAFDTTLLGLTGLIVIGFARWTALRAGDAAVTHVDSIAEDFVAQLPRNSQSGFAAAAGGGGEAAAQMPDRLSRMALDVWRSGHPKEQFLEERVLEGVQENMDDIRAIHISAFPYFVALMREKAQGTATIELYRFAVGRGDGLFALMLPLQGQSSQTKPHLVSNTCINGPAGLALTALSENELGLVQIDTQKGRIVGTEPLPIGESNLGQICFFKSDQPGKIRVAITLQQNGNSETWFSSLPHAPHDMNHFSTLPGALLAATTGSSFLAVRKNDGGGLAIHDVGIHNSEPQKVFEFGSHVNCVCMAAWQKRIFIANNGVNLHQALFDPLKSGSDAFSNPENIQGKAKKRIQSMGVLGEEKRMRIIYLQEDGELYMCDPDSGKRECILSNCAAMATSTDGRYVLTYDNTIGLRAWGFRPESA